MNPTNKKRHIILLITALVAADQLSKWLCYFFLRGPESINLLTLNLADKPSFLNLTYHENPGIGWSLFADISPTLQVPMLIGIALIAVILLAQGYKYTRSPVGKTAVLLLIAGGIGNIIDRSILGAVIDMIDIGWTIGTWSYDFPIFNVADIYIFCGVVTCFGSEIYMTFAQRTHRKQTAAKAIDENQIRLDSWKEKKLAAKLALKTADAAHEDTTPHVEQRNIDRDAV